MCDGMAEVMRYLLMGPGHSQNFGYGLWANWYLLISRAVSRPTESTTMCKDIDSTEITSVRGNVAKLVM